ncbi:hypothetical protein ACLB0R_13925 [Sphingomonas sp. GlSt437]
MKRTTWLSLARGVAAVLALGGAGHALAQALVVKASGPSASHYPAGTRLAAGARVTLAAGDTLVLLDGHGTRTLQGPGSFPATASTAAASANNGVAALLAARRTGQARIGAVRNVEGEDQPTRSPNLWYVDFAKPQTACVPDLGAVKLWRADIAKQQSFKVIGDKGESATVVMPAGQAVAIWPKTMPVSDGAHFAVSGGSLTAPVDIRFAKVDSPQVRADAVADALISHGCTVQLDLLLAAVPSRTDAVAGN